MRSGERARQFLLVRASFRLALAATVLVVAVACGDDDEGAGQALPPADDAGLEELFQPFFDPLGLEFTYGGVVDFREGKHLQLYVEPAGPATDEQYLERLVSSSAAIIPFVFAEYSELDTFDICQEPVPGGYDDPDKPEPRTVVLLSREQAASVDDWSTATLTDLIRASLVGEGGEVRVDDAIAALPAYVEAAAAAERDPPA
jgi:hypothetical protein